MAGAPRIADALAGLREFAGDAIARRAQRRLRPRAPGGGGAAQRHAAAVRRLVRHARGGAPALPRARPPRAAGAGGGARALVAGAPGAAGRRGHRGGARPARPARRRPRRGGAAPARERLVGAAARCWTPAPRRPKRLRRRWSPTSRRRGPVPLAILPVKSDAWRPELGGDGDEADAPGLTGRLPGFRRRAGSGGVRRRRRPHLQARRHRRLRGRHGHGQEPRRTCCRRPTQGPPPAAASS